MSFVGYKCGICGEEFSPEEIRYRCEVCNDPLLVTIGALEAGLHACGYPFDSGVGVAAVQRVLLA